MVKRPAGTPKDRSAIEALVLGGFASGRSIDEIASELGPYELLAFPFTARVLTDLAADVLALAGGTRDQPVWLGDLRRRHLADYELRGRTAMAKSRAAVELVVATLAGVEPDFDETAGWWQLQDLSGWSFIALVAMLRVTAEHTGRTIEDLARTVAAARGVTV